MGLRNLLSTVGGGPPASARRTTRKAPTLSLAPAPAEDDEEEPEDPLVVHTKAKRLLVPHLDAQIEKNNHRDSAGREGAFHVSSLYYLCPRQWILQHFFPENKKEAFSGDLLRLFQIGHKTHDAVQTEWLGPAGVLKGRWICTICEHVHHDCFMPEKCGSCSVKQTKLRYKEPGCGHKGLNIKGHSDGIVVPGRHEGDMTEWGLEAKTIKPENFKPLKAPLPAHLHQFNVYMHLLKLERGIFLYFCKSSGAVKEYRVEYDPSYWHDVENKLGSIQRFLRKVRDNGGKADPSWLWQTKGLCYSETSRWALWCHQSEPCMALKGYRKGSSCSVASTVLAKSLEVRGKPLTVVVK